MTTNEGERMKIICIRKMDIVHLEIRNVANNLKIVAPTVDTPFNDSLRVVMTILRGEWIIVHCKVVEDIIWLVIDSSRIDPLIVAHTQLGTSLRDSFTYFGDIFRDPIWIFLLQNIITCLHIKWKVSRIDFRLFKVEFSFRPMTQRCTMFGGVGRKTTYSILSGAMIMMAPRDRYLNASKVVVHMRKVTFVDSLRAALAANDGDRYVIFASFYDDWV